MDPPPRTKHKPNKVKIDASQPLTSVLDLTLQLKLKTFHKELHAKYWGDTEDTLIGPHLFLMDAQIQHLCHLTHANVLWNVNDLYNNFKWNWMPCYGESLLCLIQSVYEPNPMVATNTGRGCNTKALLDMPVDSPMEPSISNIASSSSKRTVKSIVKMGPGSQCCSACHTPGHNSKLCLCLSLIHSLADYSIESNPQCPLRATQPSANTITLPLPQ